MTKLVALVFGLSMFALPGCNWPGAEVYPPITLDRIDARPAIVIVPGYYGSSLIQATTKDRFFVDPVKVLFGKYALSLFQKELGTPTGPDLEVEGLIGSVPLIPHLYSSNVYSSLIDDLRGEYRTRQIIPFSYDWRLGLTEAASRLGEILETLEKRGSKNVTVIGHSMGGLVLAYYLGYGRAPLNEAALNWNGAQKVHKAVFVGVPFQGTMYSLRNTIKGAKFRWNKNMLQADAVSSFPSIYHLLPTGVPDILDLGKKNLDHSLYDSGFWKKYKVGLLQRTDLDTDKMQEREKFLEVQLATAKRFSDFVQLGRSDAWQPPANLAVLNVVGEGRPTISGAFYDTNANRFYFDEDELTEKGLLKDHIYRDGDGVVTRASASVPMALEKVTRTISTTSFPHDALFKDGKMRDEIINFVK